MAAGAREFSENGYSGTTSKSISKRAGVSTGTFYQYFVDKDAVLRQVAGLRQRSIADQSLLELEQRYVNADKLTRAAHVAKLLSKVVTAVLNYHREDPGLHAVLTARRAVDDELDQQTVAADKALVARIAKLLKQWGGHDDPQALAFVMFGMVEGAIHAHVLGSKMVSDDRFRRALTRSLINLTIIDNDDDD